MKTRALVSFALGFLILAPGLAAQQRDPAVLLESARYQAHIRGDFRAALEILDSLVQGSAAGARRDVVVACSALRRRHRRRLSAAGATKMFFLDVPVDELDRRLRRRRAHFFPPSLLNSQLAALDPVQPDEGALVIDGNRPVDDMAHDIVTAIRCLQQ